MSLDFDTVRYLRVLFGLVAALVGVGAGLRYLPQFGLLSMIGGGVIGFVVGWNLPDLFKGRAKK